jgi:hypothetical protein
MLSKSLVLLRLSSKSYADLTKQIANLSRQQQANKTGTKQLQILTTCKGRGITLILNSACKKLQGAIISANSAWKKLQRVAMSEAPTLQLLKKRVSKYQQGRSAENPNSLQNKGSNINPNSVY